VNAKTSPGEGEKKRDWKGAKKLDWKGEGRSAEERFVDKLVLVWRDPHK